MRQRVAGRLIRAADRGTQIAYGLTGGRFGERQVRYRILLLHTTGRKTGLDRTHALLYIRDGADYVVCGSNFGAPTHPAWYLNLCTNPTVRIQVGRVQSEVSARTASPDERARLWPKLCAVRPQYATYQATTSRMLPVVILTPRTPHLDQGGVESQRYVFDPATLHELALQHLGPPAADGFAGLIDALTQRYPHTIHREMPWIFNNAGGVMIQCKFLYASAREYVLIFGTPVGSAGHSGRHPAEFHDTVLDGEAWYYREGQFERDVYRSGDAIYLGRGQSAGIHIPDHVWMLEYARGALPLLLPFGLADAFFSTLDLKTVLRTLAVYVSLNIRKPSR
jgi:C-8 sterol isomerase